MWRAQAKGRPIGRYPDALALALGLLFLLRRPVMQMLRGGAAAASAPSALEALLPDPEMGYNRVDFVDAALRASRADAACGL